MSNSIIDAQFDFFHDRTISQPEPPKEGEFISSLHLLASDILDRFPGPKRLPDKTPVDKMYVYKLPDIVITFADEVYRICKELPEEEAKEEIENLDPEDYPIVTKQKNPYSATHNVEYEPSKSDLNFISFLSSMVDDVENDKNVIRWHEESWLTTEKPQ